MTMTEVLRVADRVEEIRAFRAGCASMSAAAVTEMRASRAAMYADAAAKRVRGAGDERAVTLADGDVAPDAIVTELHEDLVQNLAWRAGYEVVVGYGSVFNTAYVVHDMFGPFLEVMDPGAFDKSLADPGLRMSLLTQHDSLGLAETTSGRMAVGADHHGLGFAAALNLAEPSGLDLAEKLRSGSTSSDTSVAGYIREFEWDDDYTVVTILDWGLSRGEISVCHAGANPAGYVRLLEDSRALAAAEVSSLQDAVHLGRLNLDTKERI